MAISKEFLGWSLKSKLATLSNILLKRKKIKIEKSINTIKNKKESLSKKQNYSFKVMLEQWLGSDYAVRYCEITKLLFLAALIPPSTAEVERSFSLKRLICTKLHKWKGSPMKIWQRLWEFVNTKGKLTKKKSRNFEMLTKPNRKKDASKADYVDIIVVLCILPSRNPFKKNHCHSLFLNCELAETFLWNRKSFTQYFWM